MRPEWWTQLVVVARRVSLLCGLVLVWREIYVLFGWWISLSVSRQTERCIAEREMWRQVEREANSRPAGVMTVEAALMSCRRDRDVARREVDNAPLSLEMVIQLQTGRRQEAAYYRSKSFLLGLVDLFAHE